MEGVTASQPLELGHALGTEAEAIDAGDQSGHQIGDEHFTTVGLGGNARRHDHSTTVEVVALSDRLAGVYADTHTDGLVPVPRGHEILERQGEV